jgi:diphthamide synthase (EF-2-diphthine--ammonia ligase)
MLSDYLLGPQTRIRGLCQRSTIESWLRLFHQARQGRHAGEISREGLYQRIVIVLALELWLRKHNLSW